MTKLDSLVLGVALALATVAYGQADRLPIAMGGKCSVCLLEMRKVVDGTSEFASVHDGKTYIFPSSDQKKMFDGNPARFVPALGGDCTVCLVEMGKYVPGKAEHSLLHDGRIYLFPGPDQLAMFQKNPSKYESIDLALDGFCAVCAVEKNELVKGVAEHATFHDGRRYLFPSTEQQRMFERDSERYAPALGGGCVVCLVDMKRSVRGKAEFRKVVDRRLYVFPGQEQLDMFLKNPNKYTRADIAFDGNCAVCRVDMKRTVAGKPEFGADHHGKRYLFPDAMLREKFIANPSRYALQ